jgi:hypothetical protein
MRIRLAFRTHMFQFPAATAPAWSGQVDRAYQLDACAYGVADATEAWQRQPLDPPSLVILASPGGSNHTDWLFAQTTGTSPSLFVHTLPNTRGSSFCQIMNWSGPVLCIQHDPITCLTALREAIGLVGQDIPTVWIISVQRDCTRDAYYAAHLLSVSHTDPGAGFCIEQRCGTDEVPPSDARFLAWLRDTPAIEPELRLLDGYVARVRGRNNGLGGRFCSEPW